MASGKLSPRQKMINMMYLVLTALLAMNVSKEVLESFHQLAASMYETAAKMQTKNRQTAGDIKASIEEEVKKGNTKNKYIAPLIDNVLKETNEVIEYIDLKSDTLLSKKIGGTEEGVDLEKEHFGMMKNKSELEANLQWWLKQNGQMTDNDGHGAGAAWRLHQRIDAYVDWANDFYKDKIDTTGEAKDMFRSPVQSPDSLYPNIAQFRETRQKTWEVFNFDGPPAIANLALLQKLKNDIRVIEGDLLQFLRQKLNNIVFQVDSIVGMAVPEASTVVAGLPFKTRVFPTIRSESMSPTFSSGSGKVKTDPSGFEATLTITPNKAGTLPISALIKVRKATGETVTVPAKTKVDVKKPVVEVSAAALKSMYAKCLNEAIVSVPALGANYSPVFKAKGADIFPSENNVKKVGIVPTNNKGLLLRVSNKVGGRVMKIDDLKYSVIQPPKPEIQYMVNGQPMTGNVPKGKLVIKVIPNKQWAQNYKRDARYQIGRVRLLKKEGFGGSQTVATKGPSAVGHPVDPSRFASITFDLGLELRNARKGTTFFVEIDKIQRVNFRKQQLPIKYQRTDLTNSAVIQ